MNASFKTQKDASFTDNEGKAVSGRFLSDFEGKRYKLYGKAAEAVELSTDYSFEVKSYDKNGVALIDGKSFHKAGAEPPEPKHEEPREPAINREKQTSIERQHAITRVIDLYIAGKLPDNHPVVEAALRYLTMQVMGAGNAAVQKAMEAPVVAAAVSQGAVITKAGTKQFPTLGAFLNKCHEELQLERPDVEKLLGEKVTAQTDLDGAWVALNNVGK